MKICIIEEPVQTCKIYSVNVMGNYKKVSLKVKGLKGELLYVTHDRMKMSSSF